METIRAHEHPFGNVAVLVRLLACAIVAIGPDALRITAATSRPL